MADETKMAPLPWRRNEYGDVLDAKGERVSLVGFAMACGTVPDDDERRRSTDYALRAVHAYGPMRAALGELRASFGQNASEERLRVFAEAGMVLSVDPRIVARLMRALGKAEGRE